MKNLIAIIIIGILIMCFPSCTTSGYGCKGNSKIM